MSTTEKFQALLVPMAKQIKDRPLDTTLEAVLNMLYPPSSKDVMAIFQACQDGIRDGWMCKYEAGGIRYGRVIKPTTVLHGMSVDVVDMDNVVGPHHFHPNGEIDLVMPITSEAKFDGRGAGWKVYSPGSAHSPSVSEGRALVLYLLAEGAIDFVKPDDLR